MSNALITCVDFDNARNSVADGEIFAQGVDVDFTYDARLRRDGYGIIVEIRTSEDTDWHITDMTNSDGVIDIADILSRVVYYRTN